MTVLERGPELKVYTNRNTGLTVDPTDITFDDLTGDTVMIRVKIRNEGEQRSSPTFIRLESAPFGAFVPWQPLATLPVAEIEPGESRELSVAATRPHPMPLGDFDGVPPMSVLTALNASPDEPTPQPNVRLRTRWEELSQGRAAPRPANNPPTAGRPTPQPNARSRMLLEQMLLRDPKQVELKRRLDLLRQKGAFRPARNATPSFGRVLPPDLWELFGREQPHWAGNINVFVGYRAVERHLAKALRIYPGRTNLAMFVVGGRGKLDAYAFDLVGLPSDWKAALYNRFGAKSLVVRSPDMPIQERQWVQSGAGWMMVMLAVSPPVNCKEGNVQVHVTRRSCQDTAVVEFNLNPTAQGPGCYVV